MRFQPGKKLDQKIRNLWIFKFQLLSLHSAWNWCGILWPVSTCCLPRTFRANLSILGGGEGRQSPRNSGSLCPENDTADQMQEFVWLQSIKHIPPWFNYHWRMVVGGNHGQRVTMVGLGHGPCHLLIKDTNNTGLSGWNPWEQSGGIIYHVQEYC